MHIIDHGKNSIVEFSMNRRKAFITQDSITQNSHCNRPLLYIKNIFHCFIDVVFARSQIMSKETWEKMHAEESIKEISA